MNVTRAAPYIVGASLLGAWLSSAASSVPQEGPAAPAVVMESASEPAGWAADVQQQSRRLHDRLAAGPPAPTPGRNPFEFRSARRPVHTLGAVRPTDPQGEPDMAVPAASELSLIGVASQQRPDGVIRTAMIATWDGELIMAVVGDIVLQRFTVAAVGADSADLVDPETGATLRLRLD